MSPICPVGWTLVNAEQPCVAGGRRVSAGGWRLCDCRVGSGRAGPGQASLGHGSCGHCFTPHCAAGLSLEPEPFSRLPWGNVMFTAIPIHTQHNEQCSAPPSSVRFSPKSLLSSSRIHPPPSLYLDPSLHHFILLILCGFHIHLSILPCPPPPAASLLFLPSTSSPNPFHWADTPPCTYPARTAGRRASWHSGL